MSLNNPFCGSSELPKPTSFIKTINYYFYNRCSIIHQKPEFSYLFLITETMKNFINTVEASLKGFSPLHKIFWAFFLHQSPPPQQKNFLILLSNHTLVFLPAPHNFSLFQSLHNSPSSFISPWTLQALLFCKSDSV